ncbi:RHS repeat domain-containing protein [Flavobacterium branchiicola]|uniref:RHS repeat domain-containing protein n=1 Tax=Flavobacterium branchiicola TaxID=1114875 RepID=A0ABV9PAN7_9FLAO|nr:RHS repeat-associated core domain-containing protein [Flavobacterium branchiicola]
MVYDKPEPIENLITWVYESGSFVPSAKIVGDEKFSIINDYIGRPIQSYDGKGNLIWETDYDIYGGLRDLKGDRNFIPFRQLGQYEDIETGLYYNRFRYYNVDSGGYISQDPIGVFGGNAFYAYVHNTNSWVDIFGLSELVYQLLNEKGEVIYYVITERDALVRGQEHINGTKTTAPQDFASMEVLEENLDHDQARTMETTLIRERLEDRRGKYKATDSIEDKLSKSGLLNKNRGRDIDVPGRKYTGDIPKLDSLRKIEGLKFKCN